MPQPNSRHILADWWHGLLYCVASLVLGIELNIIGPTVDSLATQIGVAESALGGGTWCLPLQICRRFPEGERIADHDMNICVYRDYPGSGVAELRNGCSF